MTIAELLGLGRVRVTVVTADTYEEDPDNMWYEAIIDRAVPNEGEPALPGVWFRGGGRATLVLPGAIEQRSDGKIEVHDRTHDDYYVLEVL